MTQEQREKLYRILGRIEGLTWGVDNSGVAEGFAEASADLATFLKEDVEDENT